MGVSEPTVIEELQEHSYLVRVGPLDLAKEHRRVGPTTGRLGAPGLTTVARARGSSPRPAVSTAYSARTRRSRQSLLQPVDLSQPREWYPGLSCQLRGV